MHEKITELLPLYALGSLEGPDLDEIEAHLAAGCDECSRELVELENTMAELAYAVLPATPPPALRERLLSQLGQSAPPAREPIPFTRPRKTSTGPGWLGGTGVVATAASLLAAAAVAVIY